MLKIPRIVSTTISKDLFHLLFNLQNTDYKHNKQLYHHVHKSKISLQSKTPQSIKITSICHQQQQSENHFIFYPINQTSISSFQPEQSQLSLIPAIRSLRRPATHIHNHIAAAVRHNMMLNNPKHCNPTWNPRRRLKNNRS